jgi:hypothetical protein
MEAPNDNLLRLNGTSLYAIKEGQGEAVVFMHGFGLDHRMWKRQTSLLRDGYTVINYDLRVLENLLYQINKFLTRMRMIIPRCFIISGLSAPISLL